MGAYLIDNPPARSQYRFPRRAAVSGVIALHTAENTPDTVATDGGAEAVARFIQGRDTPGSYHTIVDSDSSLRLVPFNYEAFHDGTGTNPHSLGLSIATRADLWPIVPEGWRLAAVARSAVAAVEMATWVKDTTGIVIPARRVTAAQARSRWPGFVTHAELDPARRTDPGAAFPFSRFLSLYREGMNPDPTPTPPPAGHALSMQILVKGDDSPAWFITNGLTKRHVKSRQEAGIIAFVGLAKWNNGEAYTWPQEYVDAIPVQG